MILQQIEMFQYTIPESIKRIKIDIGLSYGAPQSQTWLEKEKDLFVFGFEPNPENVASLRQHRIEKRHPSHGQPITEENKQRFHLFPYAVSNVNTPVDLDFYMMEKDSGTSSLFKPIDPTLGAVKQLVKVPVVSLSQFLESFPFDRFPYIEYMKIDAQGADLDILKSAGAYLSERFVLVTAEADATQYENSEHNTEKNIQIYMQSQGFIQIQHPNTADPTFVNIKFVDLAKNIFIYQRG